MSLIYFHIVLMLTGAAFFFGFGLWELSSFSTSHQVLDLAMAIGSFVFAVGLTVYLIWFIKKKKPQMNKV